METLTYNKSGNRELWARKEKSRARARSKQQVADVKSSAAKKKKKAIAMKKMAKRVADERESLLREGVEPNPGPPPVSDGDESNAHAARRRNQKRPKQKNLGKTKAGQLAEELKNEAEKVAAPVESEPEDYETLYRLNRLFEETDGFSFLWTRPDNPLVSFLPECIHGIIRDLDCGVLSYKPDVACTIEELDSPLSPHNAVRVTFQGVEEVLGDSRLPQHRGSSLVRGHYFQARFLGEVVSFGFLRVVKKRFNVLATFSVESFLEAMHRRLSDSGDFEATRRRVVAFRSNSFNVGVQCYDLDLDTNFCDCVFTSLLLLNQRNIRATGFDVVAHDYAHRIFGSLGRDRPSAPGTYVIGYCPTWNEVVDASYSANRKCGIAMRSVKGFMRRNLSHCVLAPIHVSGFLPSFPNPVAPASKVIGALKRLCVARMKRTDRSADIMKEVVDNCCSRVTGSSISDAVVSEECALVCRMKGFKGKDAECYMSGVLDALGHHVDYTLFAFKNFVKSETYDPDSIKPARFIISPDHYVRGVSHALLYRAQVGLARAFHECSVKGRTAQEITARLADFKDRSWFLETDYTSMESNVREWDILNIEMPLFMAAAHPSERSDVAGLFRWFANHTVRARSKDLDIWLPPMRLSGQDHTSMGNFLCNMVWCGSILCEYFNWDASQLARYPSDSCLFEGDDGMIHVGHEVNSDWLKSCIKNAGVRLKFNCAKDYHDLHFCGNHLVFDGDVLVRIKNPLEVLSRVMSLFRPNASSNKQWLGLQISKVRSYYLEYSHLPIVGPVCLALLNKYGDADVWVRNKLRDSNFDFSRPFLEVLDLARRPLGWIDSFVQVHGPSVVTSRIRAAIESKYNITCALQSEIERSLVAQIQVGKMELECPALLDFWGRLKGVSRMASVTLSDLRQDSGRWASSGWNFSINLFKSLPGALKSISWIFDLFFIALVFGFAVLALNPMAWFVGLFLVILMGAFGLFLICSGLRRSLRDGLSLWAVCVLICGALLCFGPGCGLLRLKKMLTRRNPEPVVVPGSDPEDGPADSSNSGEEEDGDLFDAHGGE
jgi:hypothetical protein